MLHELIMALARESRGEFKNAAAARTFQPGNYPVNSRAAMIVPLLLHDLQASETTTQGNLPLPSDRRLRAICSELLATPANDETLDHWSETVGASARTLGRLFRQETGLTFGQWRQQLRLVEAVSRLALGDPVSKVADELGYQSSSGFIAMFRRALGETPQRYLKSDVR